MTGSVSKLEGRCDCQPWQGGRSASPWESKSPAKATALARAGSLAIVLEVRKAGSRVKIILSRTHVEFVRRLFELEIPEVGERVIEVRSLAREAGYRSKVAVSCIDNNIDAVGACVGVRGARIKNITGELGDEKIDIVRWNDSLQVLVPNALQPAEVEDVILCPMLGRVIVLVRDDQLSLAIGKRGQNVRLASKLVGWDIEVMTREELDEQLERSVQAFSEIPGVTADLAENLVAQGFLSFDDLSVIEPDQLAELGSLSEEECDVIVAFAEKESERLEAEQRQRRATERSGDSRPVIHETRAEPAPSAPPTEALASEDPVVANSDSNNGAVASDDGVATEETVIPEGAETSAVTEPPPEGESSSIME